jgi:hypothetical protein
VQRHEERSQGANTRPQPQGFELLP